MRQYFQALMLTFILVIIPQALIASSDADDLEQEADPRCNEIYQPKEKRLLKKHRLKIYPIRENRLAGFGRSGVKVIRNLTAAGLDLPVVLAGSVVSAVEHQSAKPLLIAIPIGTGLVALHLVGTVGAGVSAFYRLGYPRLLVDERESYPFLDTLSGQVSYPFYGFVLARDYYIDVTGEMLTMYKDPKVLF